MPAAQSRPHAALPYADVLDFIAKLRQALELGEATKLAFEFLILTSGRTREVLDAQFNHALAGRQLAEHKVLRGTIKLMPELEP